jgi:hypothetical protein
MKMHVALIADARGYYCHVWGKAPSWDHFLNQLEDIGVEVIEDQTEESLDNGWTEEEIKEDYISIDYLVNHTDYVPYP